MLRCMTPKKRATAPGSGEPGFGPHPDDVDEVRAGLAEAERGQGAVVTPEQLKRWAETGEWPDSSG